MKSPLAQMDCVLPFLGFLNRCIDSLSQRISWLQVCLLTLFVLAGLVRLDEIRAPGDLMDREYTSAIFARAYFFSNNENIEEWRREIAIKTKDQQPILEPPLVEYLVSLIYRVVGKEEIFYSRYLTSTFWLIGGIFMYLIAAKVLSVDAAIFATGYYLFVPVGIIISRSFQPDSLMMMLFLMSLYFMVDYFERPTGNRLFLVSATAGITLLLRPLVVFAIFCAFAAASLYRNRNAMKSTITSLLIFSGIGLLPLITYYGYGVIFAGFMRWKVTTSFMPHLLTEKDFWMSWFDLGSNVIGYTALLGAIIGFSFLSDSLGRYIVAGLATGYVIFGVVFTYHIHTHGYYHIQLFPVISLCVAALMVRITSSLKQAAKKFWLVPVVVAVVVAVYFSYRIKTSMLYQVHFENPEVAREIGEAVNHSPRTVFVAYYYGIPLEYYGEFTGAPWPKSIVESFYRQPGTRALSVQERLDNLGFLPEYFVITHFDLYERKHQDLRAYLESKCLIHAQTESYLIYTDCQSIVD